MLITLIGCGEGGHILAEGLRAKGAAVIAFNVKLSTSQGSPLRAHAQAHAVVLAASHSAAVFRADAVIESMVETFAGIDWKKQGAYLFQRVIEHGRRRSEEILEVAQTVRAAGLLPHSANGTALRQAGLADRILAQVWAGVAVKESAA